MWPEQIGITVKSPWQIKFIYSEKATKFCEIPTVDLSYVVTVKSTVAISQKFLAFSEYMNFIIPIRLRVLNTYEASIESYKKKMEEQVN